MPGLVPGIHVLRTARQHVDGRDKPGHDGEEMPEPITLALLATWSCGHDVRAFAPLPHMFIRHSAVPG
ncbi:hypothetical protein EAS62_00805 [Bradyrhizobium zhanjiangense]|uniref:Uncharacterized protein n=1 Tax=Bradyrhizobium zhanjiangense TaxID=1325107 RepID=A0ABY0DT99_9BRAD|nr:hypothetical protein EAS62_00805 [Bradyrhizobium zhanjiangense]